MRTIRIQWLGSDQYWESFHFKKGMIFNVPPNVAQVWIKDGWAEEVKPKKKEKSKEEVKDNG